MNVSDWNYIDCAAASDGGSLCLFLSNKEGEFNLSLDREIGSETHNQLLIGDRLLSFAEEKLLLPNLEQLSRDENEPLSADFIGEFIDLIESR